ncbi:MAG: sigma-70 family RNA polymerase sigma factor, partial [Planctomycetes bacterium]|nr:sigma-70 family RNA polymerase sigma factor [Planctomycetota bacterium]
RYRTSDLVQSALVEAIASMPAFRGTRESEFVGWTLRILERNALDRQRRLLARKRCVDREVGEGEGTVQLRELALDTASPSELAIDREQLIRIARAMRRLPTDQRRILQLIALRGASHAEAAELIGRSEGACRVLLARARAALVVALAREAGR